MDIEVSGKTVHAATGGVAFDATKPTIVFIHGAGMDHTVWALQTRYFAYNGWSVLAVDLPGHGKSAGPPLGSIAELATWVWHLVGAAGADRAALGASPAMPVNDDLLTATRDDPSLASALIVSWAFGGRSQIGGMRAPGLWMTGGGLQLLERAEKGVLHADFNGCNEYKDGLTSAAKVTCPALIVSGAEDVMTPARAAQPLTKALADSRTIVIPDCGHMMMVEQPDRTLDALKSFI
jgi:pimeloyl-ACP methyl ester carboxylesterase